MSETLIPVSAIGKGSQPAEQDGAALEFIKMPSEMMTYSAPVLPEPEDITGLESGIAVLAEIHQALSHYTVGSDAIVIDLMHLDNKNRQFLNEAFGDGEVSIMYNGHVQIHIQESVLAGVWRVHYVENSALQRDTIEICDVPNIVRTATFVQAKQQLTMDDTALPEGLMNATSLITELNEQAPMWKQGDAEYVINLSLLPHTEEDLAFLGSLLGSGPVTILSRGYGNCRITSTAMQNVWWVQYFNSQDTIILNTLEISDIPKVACAATEDIEDSKQRMGEILELYQ